MEQTFVMLKPGVLPRRICGEIIRRFERKGLKIVGLKLLRMGRTLAEALYAEHKGRDFYEKLLEYSLSGPVIAMILEGEGAVLLVRHMIGPTNIAEMAAGTIRGDFAAQTRLNVVHASDAPASAERERGLFFSPAELCPWEDGNRQWF
jgi:nucleoside-diphosphate kinase